MIIWPHLCKQSDQCTTVLSSTSEIKKAIDSIEQFAPGLQFKRGKLVFEISRRMFLWTRRECSGEYLEDILFESVMEQLCDDYSPFYERNVRQFIKVGYSERINISRRLNSFFIYFHLAHFSLLNVSIEVLMFFRWF